jgi:hypothetical protein
MKIEGENPETGEKFQADASGINSEFIDSLLNINMSDESLKRFIDNLEFSADAKMALYSFSKATILVGEQIIKIGRKVLDYVCIIYKEFPLVTFGTICGAIIGLLISSIPILGFVLGPLFTPIAIGLGLILGTIAETGNKLLDSKIQEIVASFHPLNAR